MCLHITASYTVKREGSPSQEGLALRHQKGREEEKVPLRGSTSFLNVSLLGHPGCCPTLGSSFCLCSFHRASGQQHDERSS